jgi:hypothetical protein
MESRKHFFAMAARLMRQILRQIGAGQTEIGLMDQIWDHACRQAFLRVSENLCNLWIESGICGPLTAFLFCFRNTRWRQDCFTEAARISPSLRR